MKILLISDIHANIDALRAVERVETWDEVWCCGDLTDFGAFPAETIAWVRSQRVRCVLGNHDAYVLSLSLEDCKRAYDARTWTWAHQNRELLSDDDLAFLRSLPRTLFLAADGIDYQMQHQYDGGYGTIESLFQFEAFWQGKTDASVKRMLFGHTHRRGLHLLDGHTAWLNPGSLSYRRPDDTDKQAHYLIIEDGSVRFGNVAYDRSRLMAKTWSYLRDGHMLTENLQVAFFFFGDALTTRSPLPLKNKGGIYHDSSTGD